MSRVEEKSLQHGIMELSQFNSMVSRIYERTFSRLAILYDWNSSSNRLAHRPNGNLVLVQDL
jgi:hypothetical protein